MDVETKFSIACQSGNLTTVKLLSITHKNYIKNNCLESGIYYASMYGHLKIIKFLEYFFGTKGDSFDLSTAADEGHLDVVKYFVESGVPIENNAILWATEHGHTNIVEYLTSVKNIKNANTFLILTNTGRIRRRGLLRSFRPKKERPYVPPEIAEKIMSYLEFGRSRRSRKITKKQRPQSRKRSIKRKMSYTIELAKTGRSKCKACGENIENQAVRFSSGSDRYVVWRHFPQCMTERIKNNVLVAFPNPEDIPGVDNLESKEIVTNYFNGEKETKKSVKKTKKESEEESTGSDKPTKKTKEKIELEVLLAKTLELNKKGEFPDIKGWWISEKLDGIRAYWSHKDKKLYTRSGFVIDTPAWFTKELPKDMDFDGEIWISRKLEDFNKVSGIGRKTRKTEADEEAWNTVKYMVFDVPTLEKPYEERLKTYTQVIKKMKNSPHVIPVEAWLAKNIDHVF